ncbi:MAG: Ig-like domain-containing protein, partial [Planctomycetota bacterium]
GFSDVDAGDTLTKIQVTTLESNGTLKLSGADVTLNQEILTADIGNLVFLPAQDANGTAYDSFDFKVHDGTEYSVAANTITVDVTPVQDAPTAADETITTNEDTTYTFSAVDFNFADVDAGDSLTQIQVTGLESAGSLKLNGADVALDQIITVADINAGRLTFSPVPDANGIGYDSFDFKVHDGTEFSSLAYTMLVDVTAVQDAPTAVDKPREQRHPQAERCGCDPQPGDPGGGHRQPGVPASAGCQRRRLRLVQLQGARRHRVLGGCQHDHSGRDAGAGCTDRGGQDRHRRRGHALRVHLR